MTFRRGSRSQVRPLPTRSTGWTSAARSTNGGAGFGGLRSRSSTLTAAIWALVINLATSRSARLLVRTMDPTDRGLTVGSAVRTSGWAGRSRPTGTTIKIVSNQEDIRDRPRISGYHQISEISGTDPEVSPRISPPFIHPTIAPDGIGRPALPALGTRIERSPLS